MSVEVGKFYSCAFRKAVFSDMSRSFSSFLGETEENSLFVVLEVGYKIVNKDKLYRLKILTADGMVGYIQLHPDNLKSESP